LHARGEVGKAFDAQPVPLQRTRSIAARDDDHGVAGARQVRSQDGAYGPRAEYGEFSSSHICASFERAVYRP